MDILSQTVIDQLVADTSIELLPVILESFVQELAAKSNLLEAASIDDTSHDLRELAHSIKSCSSTYGALALQETSKQLEDAAAGDQRAEYPALLAATKKAMAETQLVYQDYLAKL